MARQNIDKFPYELNDTRKITGKPSIYKGWTIYNYKVKCQQTGSSKFEWRDMALAVKNDKILVGAVYQKIDDIMDK